MSNDAVPRAVTARAGEILGQLVNQNKLLYDDSGDFVK